MTIRMPKYCLEAREPGSTPCFWAGGVQWESDASLAVLFADEKLAFATLKTLVNAGALQPWQEEACVQQVGDNLQESRNYPDE